MSFMMASSFEFGGKLLFLLSLGVFYSKTGRG